jgi:hypothetical protein
MATVAPALKRTLWTCECGRKVPSTVQLCRCGKSQPVETAAPADSDLSGAADWVEQQAETPAAQEKTSGFSYRGYQQLATVALIAGLYFGSRYFGQWRASRAARTELIQALTGALGAEQAEHVASLYHAPCFEETYQIGWGRRGQGSKFDAEKYVACVAKKAGLSRSR